jgi:predicted glycoside hydrolase/deacetylase ChbG (UPF0249 family)
LARRRIRLCADDYGMAPGVSAAIRDLIARRRLNATSVMVVAPALDADAVTTLAQVAAEGRAAVGLHLTLTAPFKPLAGGRFLPLRRLLLAALARRLDPPALAAEAEAQIAAFAAAFGRPPDFVDGHQHVHLFPQVRETVLAAVKKHAPDAWVRQCGRVGARLDDAKGLLLDRFSRRFRALAAVAGVATNPAFAGTYRFDGRADFAALFPRFLTGLPDGGLIMCHPGFVDETLRGLDPLTDLREREYAYLADEKFPADLAAADAALL